jgi:sugar lactone lactonase YvrE
MTTIAGSGVRGFGGDNGPALEARFHEPRGVAVDSGGNIVIADYGNRRIRKYLAASRTIVTLAGTEEAQVLDESVPATEATLNLPKAVTTDSRGNLFIADSENYRVRRVDAASRVMTTVAGGGSSTADGPARGVRITPLGLAVDPADRLFIADTWNHRIRRLDVDLLTTIAGTGIEGFNGDNIMMATAARLNAPIGLAVDNRGNIFLADSKNGRIRRINAEGLITTVAASLDSPASVAADRNGNIYVAEYNNRRVIRVAPDGTIATVAGGGQSYADNRKATEVAIQPVAVAVDGDDQLFIIDYDNAIGVRRIDSAGIITTVAGGKYNAAVLGDNGPATAAGLFYPSAVAFDRQGNLLIVDTHNHRIRAVRGPFK